MRKPPKAIRRGDGTELGDGQNQDDKYLERTLAQMGAGKTQEPKQSDWSRQITRQGEALTKRGQQEAEALEASGIADKTWEEYKQELMDEVEANCKTRPMDGSTDVDCGADPRNYYS